MASLRLWVLGVAFGSFAAGMVVAYSIPLAATAASVARPEDAAYVEDLVARYGLTAAQRRQLHFVLLRSWEQRIEILQETQLPPEQSGKLLALSRKTEQRIRALLDDEQRSRYDRESRPFGRTVPTEQKR